MNYRLLLAMLLPDLPIFNIALGAQPVDMGETKECPSMSRHAALDEAFADRYDRQSTSSPCFGL